MTLLPNHDAASARLRSIVGGGATGPAALLRHAAAARTLSGAATVGRIVGIEHEFVVRLDGRPIDFRQVIHRLDIPGARIDAL
ncbi:MAG: hypothetical protein ABIV26_06120, partial [Candidatus Limnocylindrales bacterium]